MATNSAPKGTVMPVGSLFSPEETAKAARRVEDAIAERRRELDRLEGFVADNGALISLVQKLPDEISHEIMVPFGPAAFFPGRLIHTNELMVLLGEGYYAERSVKQTVEILQRRGKTLDAQVAASKASLLDLQAEAKFFSFTANEAAEGLVEIREEYIEEEQPTNDLSGSLKPSERDDVQDEEEAQMMARLDQLMKEELEEERASCEEEYDDDSDHNNASSMAIKDEELDEDEVSCGRMDEQPEQVEKHNANRDSRDAISGLEISSSETSTSGASVIISRGHNKAFTGSVLEHSDHVQSSQQPRTAVKQPSLEKPSKPVSRFKMQRGS